MRSRGGSRREARPAVAGRLARVGAVAVVAALAGCGGSGTLTRHDLVARANGACRHANAQVTGLAKPTAGLRGVADYADELQPIAGRLVDDLAKLKAPDAVRRDFDRYVGDLRGGVAKLPQLKAAARRGDAGTVQRLSGAIGSRPTDRLALRLGLAECAKHPAPGEAP